MFDNINFKLRNKYFVLTFCSMLICLVFYSCNNKNEHSIKHNKIEEDSIIVPLSEYNIEIENHMQEEFSDFPDYVTYNGSKKKSEKFCYSKDLLEFQCNDIEIQSSKSIKFKNINKLFLYNFMIGIKILNKNNQKAYCIFWISKRNPFNDLQHSNADTVFSNLEFKTIKLLYPNFNGVYKKSTFKKIIINNNIQEKYDSFFLQDIDFIGDSYFENLPNYRNIKEFIKYKKQYYKILDKAKKNGKYPWDNY